MIPLIPSSPARVAALCSAASCRLQFLLRCAQDSCLSSPDPRLTSRLTADQRHAIVHLDEPVFRFAFSILFSSADGTSTLAARLQETPGLVRPERPSQRKIIPEPSPDPVKLAQAWPE